MQEITQGRRVQFYENLVHLKFQLYNSLFLTLPLDAVEQTGLLLPLLEKACDTGLEQELGPEEIIEGFFRTHRPALDPQQQANFLFKVIQYVERQIVLLDALEDAAFAEIHQTRESNRLRKLLERVEVDGLQHQLRKLAREFSMRVILTAHPTQFYPGQVLGIITDLTAAMQGNDIGLARKLLQQLGNTPFFNKEKPTPLEEANQLGWYLTNIFYPSVGEVVDRLQEAVDANGENGQGLDRSESGAGGKSRRPLLAIGFWPGGDRDGNPFVTSPITREVAASLRYRIMECYHQDLRQLKRRLSFKGVYEHLDRIEKRLQQELTHERCRAFDSVADLQAELAAVGELLRERYQGLFSEQLESFQRKLDAFGFHFASLDIRQDSRVLAGVLEGIQAQRPELFPAAFGRLDAGQQAAALLALDGNLDVGELKDPLHRDTLESLQVMSDIQQRNGEAACHRYIVSNTRSALDVATAIALLRLSGWSDRLTLDLIPLFETIEDLQAAGAIMETLYGMEPYCEHLRRRGNTQTVMLGFSDGTKDGGYLMANWAIYRAKEDLTRVSRKRGVEVVFFDGRGGPPARGGGNAYKFFAALGRRIESSQIQLTVQGQTVSSYYGTRVAAEHNLRQLLAAGLENNLYEHPRRELDDSQRELIDALARISHEKYLRFRQHPLFLAYLEQMSPLDYYARSNIGSRPARRGSGTELRFEDLRAIPFVGAWGQLKQNVPGYFGLGSALREMERQGRLEDCQKLYADSGFFEALIGNSMQSMKKANFKLTSHMQRHPVFAEFWQLIHDEYALSREMVLKVSGQSELLGDNATSRHSIELRERVVLPLLVIQQYALLQANALSQQEDVDEAASGLYERMIVRTLFGNTNASRNSA